MAEPVLRGLDVHPVTCEERRLGVPELMELQVLVARSLDTGDSMGVHVLNRAPLLAEAPKSSSEDVRVVVASVDVRNNRNRST